MDNRMLKDTLVASVAKQDLRVRKTHAALVAAFERLTSQYGYDDISVSALCNEAMVRRSTFYKHFADKDDFLLHYFYITQGEFERRAAVRDDESLESYLPRMNAELLRFLESRQLLVAGFLKGGQANLIVQALADHIARNIGRRMPEDMDEIQAASCANFIAGGIARTIQHEWIPADEARRIQIERALYDVETALLKALPGGMRGTSLTQGVKG